MPALTRSKVRPRGTVGVSHAHGVVGDGGHEAGEACDAMLLNVRDADAAELQLCEGRGRVDVHGRADGAEGALPRLVREAGVAAERIAGEDVDELT